MMPYQSYQVYQAERPKTATEIRRADEQLGHMAENVSRLWRHAIRPITQVEIRDDEIYVRDRTQNTYGLLERRRLMGRAFEGGKLLAQGHAQGIVVIHQ